MFSRFTDQARQVCNLAGAEASMMAAAAIGSEHLLLGVLQLQQLHGGAVLSEMRHRGLSLQQLREEVHRQVIPSEQPGSGFSPHARRILTAAWELAEGRGENEVDLGHIATALLSHKECRATEVLRALQLDPEQLQPPLTDAGRMGAWTPQEDAGAPTRPVLVSRGSGEQRPNLLERYTRELVAAARSGELLPLQGREPQLQALAETLSRRGKNAPLLVGEPGVGKTALVEGLAQRVAEGAVPPVLRDSRIYALELGSLMAGTRYRGDLEARLRGLLRQLQQQPGSILFVDELHAALGSGATEGGLDVATLLKPALARGELRLIGATTEKDFRRHLERDAAFERRLHPIPVPEPSAQQAQDMLQVLVPLLEQHHGLAIDPEAAETAVRLSIRFLPDRFLPDKAIDVLDHAAARLSLQHAESKALRGLREEVQLLRHAVQQLDRPEQQQHRQGELAVLLEREQREAEHWQQRRRSDLHLGAEQIAQLISEWTGVPLGQVEQSEAQRYLQLEAELRSGLIGQDEAVGQIARALRRARAGLHPGERPLGSFLFLGPTGAGKTEAARVLARSLFGDDQALLRLDMSEYAESHSLARLIGSPPGYVGYQEGGRLTDAVRRQPYQVVLFDELEKAHPDVVRLLLQILEEGQLTDARGRVARFGQTIVIATCNTGARDLMRAQSVGFGDRDEEQVLAQVTARARDALRQEFAPELLARFDAISVFHPLEAEHLQEIIQLQLGALRTLLLQQGWRLQISPALLRRLAGECLHSPEGARALRAALRVWVEDPVAQALLEQEAAGRGGGRLHVSLRAGQPQVRVAQ